MITLTNTRNQRFIFSLYHEYVCRREGTCSCTTRLVAGPGGKLYPWHDPLSVQIDARKESGPLPDSVYLVPQVREACRSGALVRNVLPVAPLVEKTAKLSRAAKPTSTATAKDKE